VIPYWPIRVEYTVQQTAYVKAETEPIARERALDPANWQGTEEPHPRERDPAR
jgi:hypothetical protein